MNNQKKIQEAKKIQNNLTKLDSQYLTDYPRKLTRQEYLSKRKNLQNKFEKLKKSLYKKTLR